MNSRIIGHVDSDCFYVSAERVRSPELRGVPCGVLGNQGACVIAKSYELKSYGVKTGTPIWEAIKLCPQGVYVIRDFCWYEMISKRMLALLKTISPKVEYYSIDEMFFDAGELSKIYGKSTEQAVFDLQKQIREEIGIPVSIGIAPTKTLAKLGSDAAKPYGCRFITQQDSEFLKSQPVGELCGVGRRSLHKLHQAGIQTCEDFANADRLKIRDILTIKGEALWYELHGESVQPIITKRPPRKAIARGGSIGRKTDDPERIIGWLVRNTERLVEALDEHQMNTELLTLSIEFNGVEGWSQTAKLTEPTSTFKPLVSTAKRMLSEAPRINITSHMHLIAERLTPRSLVQQTFWNKKQTAKRPDKSTIDHLKKQVNDKIGRFALRSGDTLILQEIYADEANDYNICDVSGKMCF